MHSYFIRLDVYYFAFSLLTLIWFAVKGAIAEGKPTRTGMSMLLIILTAAFVIISWLIPVLASQGVWK